VSAVLSAFSAATFWQSRASAILMQLSPSQTFK